MKRIIYAGACVFTLFTSIQFSAAQNIKESSLWGAKGVNWNPAGRLPDFSYAGYRSSESDLPNIAQVYDLSNNTITGTKAKPNDGINDAPFLQQLINATASGAIFIPAGRWNMDSDVLLNRQRVVIRGAVNSAGVPTTEFYQGNPRFPVYKTSGSVTSGIINMQGSQSFSAEIGKVAVDAKQGATSITLTNVGTLAKGDFIRMIQYDPADGSLADFLTGGAYQGSETANQKDKFRWFAKVVSVSGKTLVLDRPLPIPANVKWNPTISEFNLAASVTEMGVENIQFTFNNKIEFDHLKFYGFSAITMNRVSNCWVKNVVIVDSESGIALTGESCFNTLRGIKFKDVQRAKVTLPLPGTTDYGYKITQVGTGHHPLYFLSSFYNLVENFVFENIYWHEIGVEDHAHMNVYRNGKGVALAFDNHKLLPYSNLWTNIDAGVPARIFWNSGLNGLDASGNDRRGANAGIRNTYWNIQFDNSVHKLPSAPNGTAGFRSLNLVGIEGAKVNEASQLAELTAATDQVAQPDLFQAQLDRRLKGTVTGIDSQEIALEDVASGLVFPNPSSNGQFSLAQVCNWKIYNLHGQELKTGIGNQLDISENPKGIYLLKTNDRMERIVVE